MTLPQILATSVFVVMFAVIIWGKIHRFVPALVGAGLVIIVVFLIVMKDPSAVSRVLNLGEIITTRFWLPGMEHIASRGVNWQTIVFIAGMMVMVEGLAKVGFFRWMCLAAAKVVHYRAVPMLIVFTVLSGFLSMFIDSITVMLFLATVTIELARLLEFDPVPVIIAEIFASNVGGSATMSGDPPNIIIGTSLGYTFTDFVVNAGLIAWAGMILAIIFFYFAFRKTLSTPRQLDASAPSPRYLEPREAITNAVPFALQTGVLILAVALLVTHAQTGISVALVGVIAAALTLLVANRAAFSVVKKIDWRTLLFFLGLFICVGGLEETGMLRLLASFIGRTSGGSLMLVVTSILWISAFASAVIDNIPFAATMVPVISQLGQTTGLNLHPIAWALALGTDIGGNGTPIGASANVVGTAISEREGYKIGWGRYLKYAMPSMILVVGLCNLLLFVRYQ